MPDVVVNSESALSRCIGELSAQYAKHKYLRVSVRTGKRRTLDQNALSFQLYTDIHRAKPETFPSVNDARAYCKLHFGVGIRRQEADYNEVYAGMIRDRFSYEEKLALMIEPVDFPVTRGMSRKQFSEFVEAIKAAFPDVHFRPFEGE